MAAKTAKEPRLPKGVGRVPQWWIEITPHDTLYIEDDEARRFQEEEEKKMYAKLAAMDDLLQKYGGEGFPDWDPGMHGPRTPEEEEEWVKTGYQRNTKTGIWENESGQPLTGRQFEGVLPPGYTPGEFNDVGGAGGGGGGGAEGGGGPGFGQGQLNSTEGRYGRDDQRQWDKPDWMKVKLRSTKKVTPAAPEVAAPEPTPAPPVADEGEDEVIEEEEVEETGDGFGGTMVKKIRRKKSVNSYTASSSSASSASSPPPPPATNTTSNGGVSDNEVKASKPAPKPVPKPAPKPTPSQPPQETGGTRIASDLQRQLEARRAKEESGVSSIDKPTKIASSQKQPRIDSDLQKQLLARRQKAEAAAVEEEIIEEVYVEDDYPGRVN